MLFKFEARNKMYEITIEEVVVQGASNEMQRAITVIRTVKGEEAFAERNTYKVKPKLNEQVLTYNILQETFDDVVKIALADKQSWEEFKTFLEVLPKDMRERMMISLYKARDTLEDSLNILRRKLK